MSLRTVQKKYLVELADNLCIRFNCDMAELAGALNTEEVKKAIVESLHFSRYTCFPNRCKACKKNIPHDDPIFDHESIYDYS